MPEIMGKNVKPQTLWLGGGAVLVLGIGYYRYQQNQKATAAATAPGTGAGSSDAIDPATGFAYGSTEDAAALSAQSGYVMPGSSGGASAFAPPPQYPGSTGFTNNAQWSQAAEQFLVNDGADANAVGNALGKYITGQPVNDPNAEGYINQSIAFEGYPPVPGPNGYPPSIRTAPVNPGTTPAQNVVVPRVTGMNAAQAFEVLRSEALNPQPGGIKKTRIVTATNPSAGKTVKKHTTVHVTVK